MALDFGFSLFGNPSKQYENEIISGIVKPRSGYYYVGGDFTEGSVNSSTVETEVLDFNIPANTIANGIKITAFAAIEAQVVTGDSTIIRAKVGTNGSEVERTRIRLQSGIVQDLFQQNGIIFCVVDDLDWTQAQTVSITAQNAIGNNVTTYGEYLLIEGF